jgi:hypothetical protein
MQANIFGGLRENNNQNESIPEYMNLLKNHTKEFSEIVWKKKSHEIAD